MNRRLFTFGCSFTQYRWPTWADILGEYYDEFYNWGLCGIGNLAIANRIAECHQRNKFTSDDTVYVMWTNVSREDRWLNGSWLMAGNIYTQGFYPESFVEEFADETGYYILSLAQISLVKNLLDNIGCKYKFFSMVDINNPGQFDLETAHEKSREVLNIYSDIVDAIQPSVHRVIFDCDWDTRRPLGKGKSDYHPYPLEHLEYLNAVMPDFEITDEHRIRLENFDLSAKLPYDPENFDSIDNFNHRTHQPKRHF